MKGEIPRAEDGALKEQLAKKAKERRKAEIEAKRKAEFEAKAQEERLAAERQKA